MIYDVIIVGAGVSGSAIARELSKYAAEICVLEKAEDVCCGTSKANSAIVHAGYDCKTGTMMAKMNLRGNEMMEQLSIDLDFPFRRNGSLVVCLDASRRADLLALYNQGLANGVPGLKLLDRAEALTMEPNLSQNTVAALYAPSAGIVCPFGMNIAMAENAKENGVDFFFNTYVEDLCTDESGVWHIRTCNGEYQARCVVNAAGVYADKLHNMVSKEKIHITARRGDYLLLDHEAGDHVSHTIFPQPSKLGKGVLVAPTIHGNLIVGPTATDIEDKECTATTQTELDDVVSSAGMSVRDIPLRKVITSFAGLRAHEDHHEFILQEVFDAPAFFDCAGIESPGLTSAPAIGEYMAQLIVGRFHWEKKTNWKATRKGVLNPQRLSLEERNSLIRSFPAYGQIICRCESVTEGEIVDAIQRPLGARSLDGVKRRTRAGMGRCQSGFCSPRVMEILSRELKVPLEEITKSGGNSTIVLERTKGGTRVMINRDIVIIGGGPAGLAAAVAAKENGVQDILILERADELGGILNQCIHNGFGLRRFKEELTGPEYAGRFIDKVRELSIEYKLGTMVMDISKDHVITTINRNEGVAQIQAKAVILAMGCRERPRGALNIPGYRPAGIFSAGTAQRLVNIEGYMPGREAVILGSGDIGLIMARRMTLEGAKVKVVAEIMPYSGGLKRNIVQCLDDFGIPLKLSHTVVNIEGKEHITAVTIAKVDTNRKPIPGTEERYTCDTLLLSVGLIPENELSRSAGISINSVTNGPLVNESMETNIPGVFACGNVLHVHDLVDFVSEEAECAGKNAAEYVLGTPGEINEKVITLRAEQGVRYTVPSSINLSKMPDTLTVRFRVGAVYQNAAVCVYYNSEKVKTYSKRILAPGEMEQIVLRKSDLVALENLEEITIRIEEGAQ